jgi:protein-disulfide isomerase
MWGHIENNPPDPEHDLARAPHDTGDEPSAVSAASHTRQKRLGAMAAIALPMIVVVLLIGGGSGRRTPQPVDARTTTAAHQIDALLAGIPESRNTLGSPTAPVTLQFFGDLECPTSREFAVGALPSLIARWVRGGQLRIEYRSLETATRRPAVFTAQQAAALAAGMQHKLWYYVELFYHEQGREDSGYVTARYLEGLAQQTPGLSLALWSKDRQEPPLAAQIATDEQTAARLGFHNTPSFLIGRTDSTRPEKLVHFSVLEPTAFNTALERVLAEHPRSGSSLAADSGTAGRLAFADWTESSTKPGPGSAPC